MKLKEFEGKELLSSFGIKIPKSVLINKNNLDEIPTIGFSEHVLKVQILQGKRGKNGGILFSNSIQDSRLKTEELLGKKILDEEVEEVLIEEKINVDEEYYVGFFFDSKSKSPILILSKEGGVDIEEVKENSPEKILITEINVLKGPNREEIQDSLKQLNFEKEVEKISLEIEKIYNCFKKNDMKMIEINPLVLTEEREIIAADCVAILDDNALKRHDFNFPQRQGNRKQTQREIKANEISNRNHKGVAGKVFIDLEGDIAVLASGGGASIVAMDALETYGGKAANYTEYSGNPPEDKVYDLTKLTLDKENLNGCYVVGGTANFTRIDITLKGVIDALVEIKPKYPILIRRAGPGDVEAFEMIKKIAKENDLNIHICDRTISISESAKIMVDLVNEYKESKK